MAMTARNLLLPSADSYTHYNNYIIFKNSFFHWLHQQNLYISYPAEQYDLFKYSPLFAMLFGFFALLPDFLGLALWNLLNVWLLVYAVKQIPLQSPKINFLFGILILQETITATINSQSNALIAGLLILGWLSLEKHNFWKAAIFIGLTVFIKLFGIVFFVLFLLYPKWWKGILPAMVVMGIMLGLPIISGGWQTLITQYQGYANLLANDHGTFVKYSVMGWLQSWFGFIPPKNLVVILGLGLQVAFSLFIILRKSASINSRAVLAASWLIWMVIFNHMAESATFIIAVVGVMLWFFYSPIPKWLRLSLLILVMAFTCFGPSDIYPPELRQKIVIDWQLKVFPCIAVWMVMLLENFMNNTASLARQQPLPS